MPNLELLRKLSRFSVLKLSLLIAAIVLIYLFKINSALLTPNPQPTIIDNATTSSVTLSLSEKINFTATATVISITDGDTVHVSYPGMDNDTVRLLAVNTLEKDSIDEKERCFARLATDFTKTNLLNKKVLLFSDQTQPKRDKYNRMLAYIQVGGSPELFNETLMKSGLAKTYKASPPAVEWSKYETIRQAEESSKQGIWNPELCTQSTF
jgi:micrococcal nuclease